MMSRLLFALLLTFVCVTSAQSTSCGYGNFDLSSVQNLGTLGYTSGNASYYIDVCGTISNVTVCETFSTCLISGADVYELGSWTSAFWEYINAGVPADGVQYVLQGGYCPYGNSLVSIVQFVCGNDVQMTAIQTAQCQYTYQITTPAVCGSAPVSPPCTFNGVDYSSLRTATDLTTNESGWDFYLNICSPLQSTPACMWENSATSVCGGPPQVANLNNIGNWKAPEWSFISPQNQSQGVQYTVTGDFIWDGSNLTSVVQLVCGPGTTPPTMTVEWVAPSYVFTVETELACGGTPKSTCSFDGFDFSSYQSTTEDWIYKDNNGNIWYLNVCGTSVTPACLAVDPRTSACISSSYTSDLGNWQDPVWSYIDATNPSLGVQYETIGSYQYGGYNVSTVVQFACNSVEEPMTASIEYNTTGQVYYRYVFLTNSTCTAPKSSCGYNGIDLSSFQSTTFDWTYTDNNNDTYYINVCGISVTPRCQAVDSRTSACLINSESSVYDMGSWDSSNPAVWSYIDSSNPGKGVQYTITGDYIYEGANETTVVQFVCSQTPEPLSVSYYFDSQEHLVYQYVFTTNYSCGSTPVINNTCGWNNYDFSSLSLSSDDFTASDSLNQYYLNICGSVKTEAACTQANAGTSACAINKNTGVATDLGEWNTAQTNPKWAYIIPDQPSLGVYVEFSSSVACTYGGYFTTIIQFQCTAQPTPLTVTAPAQSCVYEFSIGTPLACQTPPADTTFAGYNLAPIAGSQFEFVDTQNSYTYYLSLFSPLSGGPAPNSCITLSNAVAACQINSQTQAPEDVGDWTSSSVWSYVNGQSATEGIQVTFNSQTSSCWTPSGVLPYQTNVQFTCGNTWPTTTPIVSTLPSTCQFNFTLTTPIMCGQSFSKQTNIKSNQPKLILN